MKSALRRSGIAYQWNPQVLFEKPEGRLEVSLPMACAYHVLKHKNCRYVHIGAFDGITGDPLGTFVRDLGWEGILVEPQKYRFEQLKKNLGHVTKLHFENSAIAKSTGTAKMYSVREDVQQIGGAKGVDREFIDQWASLDYDTVVRGLHIFYPGLDDPAPLISFVEVPTLTIGDLLKKYRWDSIDLLQIDAEGLDFEILKMVDFKTVLPAIVHFEYYHLANHAREAAARLLVEHGYRLHFYHMNALAYRGEPLK